MKTRLVAATIALACSTVLGQQTSSKTGMSHTEHVQTRGCVRPGKEEGCFVLHDIKRHRYYDLTFDAAGSTPDLYTHIWFEGIGYAHVLIVVKGAPSTSAHGRSCRENAPGRLHQSPKQSRVVGAATDPAAKARP